MDLLSNAIPAVLSHSFAHTFGLGGMSGFCLIKSAALLL